ncbi:ATP-sensitive inward rectifier potassium channel 12-like [Arctopsyche grandis]|uniref:ATP-sensitive inward rectifier potassium channel 12-like n=1 Tax=Arctopsyche grandis TaxID=121162 RepID=UPI00406D9A39
MLEKCEQLSLEQESPSPEISKDLSGSEQMSQPWDKLLGDSPPINVIPKIIRTRPSFGEMQQSNLGINLETDPNSLSPNRPPPPGVGRLTRTQSLGVRKGSNGLLGSFQKQLRFSLRSPGRKSKNGGGPLFRYRQARYASRRVRKRVVFKHGDCNIVQGNVAKRRKRYLQDLFTTLVDAQWRWTLLVFAMSFLLSWLGFAMLWWLIAYAHGDTNANDGKPCVDGVDGFTSSFLFSIETQHTIGYGVRAPTVECPEAVFILCLQSIVGVFIQAFMVGLIFAKLARAKKRTTTLLFSRSAVVCLRDGEFCLLFRVGDIRKSHILEAHVRAQIIKKKVTREGELLPFYQQELKVGPDGEEDRLMFIWPTTIVHIINESSPLYNLSASDMLRERFEIVVMLEGVIESTGMTTQARSSFLPSEIFWGHRFEPIVSFRKETGEYEVDYTLFNNTYEVDTPLCSARQLDELRASVNASNRGDRLIVGANIPVLRPAPSNDTLDSCSVDSMSLDEHIEIKIPDSRIQENRRLLESQSEISSQNQTSASERPQSEQNGVLTNGHHGNNHHHHHHLGALGNHHGSHHQLASFHHVNEHLHNGINGSMQNLLVSSLQPRLTRAQSGHVSSRNVSDVPKLPLLKVPIAIATPETSPTPDRV